MSAKSLPQEQDASEQMKQAIREFSYKDFGKTLFKRFSKDNVTGLASQVAYNMVFAIPPLLLLLVTLAAIVNATTGIGLTDTLHQTIASHAPGSAQPLLDQLVTNAIGRANTGAVSIGAVVAFLLALWGSGGGIGSLMDAINRAFEVEDHRSFIKKYALQFALTLAAGILVIAAFVLPLFAHRIGSWVAGLLGMGSLFTLFWRIGSWVLAWIFITLVLALLYYFGPDVKQDWKFISPGSLVASLLWLLAILGFRFYLMLSNPASGYGAAGSVLVLLTFLWVSAIVFIIGAEINAILEKTYDFKTIRDLLHHPEKTTPETYRQVRQRAAQATAGGNSRSGGNGNPYAAANPSDDRSAANPHPGVDGAHTDQPTTATPPQSAKPAGASKLAGAVAAAGLFGAVVVQALRGGKKGGTKS